jgi:hypothetical protein
LVTSSVPRYCFTLGTVRLERRLCASRLKRVARDLPYSLALLRGALRMSALGQYVALPDQRRGWHGCAAAWQIDREVHLNIDASQKSAQIE